MAKDKLINFISILKPSYFGGIYVRIALLISTIYVSYIYTDLFVPIKYLAEIINLVVIYLALNISFTVVSLFIIFIYRKQNRRPQDYIDNFTIGINQLSSFFFRLIFVLAVIDILFIDIKELLMSLTIMTAFIAISFREHITNFINGVNIMFSGKFKLREYVKIGNHKGRIKDLTFTHVQLLTDTKDTVYVPNNLVTTREVINYSKSTVKNLFVDVVLSKDQLQHYKELQKSIISGMSRKFSDVITSKDNITIDVESIEKDTVKWKVQYIISRYNFELEKKLKNATAEIMLDFFNKKKKEEKEKEEAEKLEKSSSAKGSGVTKEKKEAAKKKAGEK